MQPINMLPAREQVAIALRNAILTGELQNGQEITQEEIANKLGVSRSPVRQAFLTLEREGILRLQKRGAIVQRLSPEDIKDHLEIRALLEGEAASRANLKCKDFKELILALEATEKAALANDASEYLVANESFHRAIWEAAECLKLEIILNDLWNGLPPQLPRYVPLQMEKSIAEHQEIVHSICKGTPDEARNAMKKHMLRGVDDFINYWNNINKDI